MRCIVMGEKGVKHCFPLVAQVLDTEVVQNLKPFISYNYLYNVLCKATKFSTGLLEQSAHIGCPAL